VDDIDDGDGDDCSMMLKMMMGMMMTMEIMMIIMSNMNKLHIYLIAIFLKRIE
jgi:hypothetical protein